MGRLGIMSLDMVGLEMVGLGTFGLGMIILGLERRKIGIVVMGRPGMGRLGFIRR